MKNKKIFLIILLVLSFYGTIHAIIPLDTIVQLKEIVVKPGKYITIQPQTKGITIGLSGKINCSVVSSVPVKRNVSYRIYGVEFYFNPRFKGMKYNGFYVKPLLLLAENNKPSKNLLGNKTYYIDKNINTKFLFDLSEYNVVIKNMNLFFVGLSFPDINEIKDINTFNIKMKEGKDKTYTTFIKSICDNCNYVQYLVEPKKTRTLVYKIYFSEVTE